MNCEVDEDNIGASKYKIIFRAFSNFFFDTAIAILDFSPYKVITLPTLKYFNIFASVL